MNLPPYIADVLSQPVVMRAALSQFPYEIGEGLADRLKRGEFKKIVMTGMGASYTGAYPTWLALAQSGFSASLIETAELLYYTLPQITTDTLLWITSQSGRSAEIQSLVEAVKPNPPAAILGITNELDSPLARGAKPVIPLHSGTEATVSTRSYMNTLAVSQLLAMQLTGGPVKQAAADLKNAADMVAEYVTDWKKRVEEWKSLVGMPRKLLFVGRGASLAAVCTGAMIMKEAAKCAVEGMSASQFRHGPLELADPDLTLVVFEGAEKTAQLNRALAQDTVRYGGKVVWVSSKADAQFPTVLIPAAPESTRPVMEILPMQMLSIALGELNGVEPGKFRNIGKVTTTL